MFFNTDELLGAYLKHDENEIVRKIKAICCQKLFIPIDHTQFCSTVTPMGFYLQHLRDAL